MPSVMTARDDCVEMSLSSIEADYNTKLAESVTKAADLVQLTFQKYPATLNGISPAIIVNSLF
jgi:hypothetical protein